MKRMWQLPIERSEAFKERLTSSELRRELNKCYNQIIWMYKGLLEIKKESLRENGSMWMIEMTAERHMKKKNTLTHYGMHTYDDGVLIAAGLHQRDPRQERINENRVDALRIMELLNGQNKKEIEEICQRIMMPDEW